MYCIACVLASKPVYKPMARCNAGCSLEVSMISVWRFFLLGAGAGVNEAQQTETHLIWFLWWDSN